MDVPKPPKKKRNLKPAGCALGCVGVILGLPLVLGLIGYIIMFHTSVPLKWFAKNAGLNSDGNGAEVNGIRGSISRGFTVEEIIIKGERDDENSTIEGLTFRYSGFWNAIRKQEFVIKEISADSSEFVVAADFFSPSAKDDNEAAEESGESVAWEAPSEASGEGQEMVLFELRKLQFADTRFRTTDGEVDIKIPLIRLAGLKVEGDDFELAELEVTSDVFILELVDALPAEVDEYEIPFTRKVQGKVLPAIHPVVKSEIDFSIELAAVDGKTKSRFIAFDGAYQQTTLPDERSFLRLQNFTVSDYIDAQGYLLPERLTVTMRESEDVVTIKSGSYFLGKTRFEMGDQQLDANDPQAAIMAQATVAGQLVEVLIRPYEERFWPPAEMEIKTEDEMTEQEQVALIFYQRGYEDLTSDEQSVINDLKIP